MKQYQKRNRLYYFSALVAIVISTIFSVTLQFFKGDILDSALAGEISAAIRWIVLLLIFILCESLFYFWVFAEMGGFLFEKGWSENIHCAKKGGFLLKATFFCVILVS